jgi:hypothetical protein
MADMSEKEKKQLFAGSVPIGLNRNQVVIGEQNFNDNLYLVRSIRHLPNIQQLLSQPYSRNCSSNSSASNCHYRLSMRA